MRRRLFLFALMLLFVSACIPAVASMPNAEIAEPVTLAPTATPSHTPVPTLTLTSTPLPSHTPTIIPSDTPTPTFFSVTLVSNRTPCQLDKQGVFYVCSGATFGIMGLPSGWTYALFTWNASGNYDTPYVTGLDGDRIQAMTPANHVEIRDENGVVIARYDIYLKGLAGISTPEPKGNDNGENSNGGGSDDWDDSGGPGDG